MPIPNFRDVLQPLINGHRYSWSSIKFKITGAPGTDVEVTEVSYGMTLDPAYVYGASAKPIGRTKGQATPKASITMTKEGFALLVQTLAATGKATGGYGFMEVPFQLVVSYEEGPRVVTDAVLGCRIRDFEDSHSQGNEGLKIKVDLSAMDVVYAGHSPVS